MTASGYCERGRGWEHVGAGGTVACSVGSEDPRSERREEAEFKRERGIPSTPHGRALRDSPPPSAAAVAAPMSLPPRTGHLEAVAAHHPGESVVSAPSWAAGRRPVAGRAWRASHTGSPRAPPRAGQPQRPRSHRLQHAGDAPSVAEHQLGLCVKEAPNPAAGRRTATGGA